MCIAELNVSLLPCRHRWYHLQRSCGPNANLATCFGKLGITGWEIKCDFCPYCSGWNVAISDYRLLGNDRSPAIGGLSRTPSLTLTTARRESRRGSLARTDSGSSITIMAQEKNRAMNARVDAYFRVPPPPEVAPLTEEPDEMDGTTMATISPSDTSSEGPESLRQSSTSSQTDNSGFIKRMRRKSKRLS
ncbi:hypothetical protein EJ04DRAFT_403088, partial [Polyplosphaeria fusca]